jgi:NADH-quinone oxidoreductase subunit C
MLITGIDWKTSWEVVYQLVRHGQKEVLTLRTRLPRHSPELPTVTHLWPGAGWHERETFDLMGIRFTGTPDPRRILLPYDYQGHPLRKDVAHGNTS